MSNLKRFLYKYLSYTLILFLPTGSLFSQTLDHEMFIDQIRNSSNNIYESCIRQYDDYLRIHPGDLNVLIEKCKFIQLAQYDDENEYNPNQEQFDSCVAELKKRFPDKPEVLIYQTTYLWGDELKEVFESAEMAIKVNPGEWNNQQKGKLYLAISDNYFWDSDYKNAYKYIQKAVWSDSVYGTSIELARILVKLNKNSEALKVLLSLEDTTNSTYDLNSKAELFLELKEYSKALLFYQRIDAIDSTYNDKSSLATTFEGTGQYSEARYYLVKDTSKSWDKENTRLRLFLHDLKFQDQRKCFESYNAYRDLGFSSDPLGLFRLKFFISHPGAPWKIRDVVTLFCLLLVIILLVILPYLWILPVYFAGHKWNMLAGQKPFETYWDLKQFWLVSSGYLLASFIAFASEPEFLYSLFNSSSYKATQETEGKITLLFIMLFFTIGLVSLYKIKPRVLTGTLWPLGKRIYIGIIAFLIYRVISGIYISIGISHFGVSADDLTSIPNVFLVAREDIRALLATYGNLAGVLLICITVPFYEEVIFRGVILDSCQRYLNFNLANIIQSALFAGVHMSLFLFPVFFLFGMVNGVLRKRSGGLLSGIVFHVVNNLLALSILLARIKSGH